VAVERSQPLAALSPPNLPASRATVARIGDEEAVNSKGGCRTGDTWVIAIRSGGQAVFTLLLEELCAATALSDTHFLETCRPREELIACGQFCWDSRSCGC
jgi:hypothetical protein